MEPTADRSTGQRSVSCGGVTLELASLTRSYGRFALGPIDALVGEGVCGLLGSNGAGKSTLMRLVAGLERPTSGSLALAGGESVGYLPQDFRAPRGVRVGEYLRFVAYCRSTRRSPLGESDVIGALERVGLADRVDAKVGELSGGMVRRLGIAQALLGESELVILDEPTVGLDPLQRQDLRALLRGLSAGRLMLISTHLSEDIAAIGDRVLVLHEGRLAFNGSTASLASRGGSSEVSGPAIEAGFLEVIKVSDRG